MSDCTQLLSKSNTNHNLLIPNLIQLFADKGMASKKAEGRVASRNALLFIKSNLIIPLSLSSEIQSTYLDSSSIQITLPSDNNTTITTTTSETNQPAESIEEEFLKLVENAIGKEKAKYLLVELKKGSKRPLAIQPINKIHKNVGPIKNNQKSIEIEIVTAGGVNHSAHGPHPSKGKSLSEKDDNNNSGNITINHDLVI